MQFTSRKSKLFLALPLAALVMMGSSHVSMAKGKGGKSKSALSKKVQANLEAAMGKPLTIDQKSQLADAAKERQDAVKEATEKFDNTVSKVTGLTLEQVKAATKKPKQTKTTTPAA